MNIHVRVIPRNQMRPEVDGADWYFDQNRDLQVRICPMSDWRFEAALILHELSEALLCKHDGVSQNDVDAFDRAFDAAHADDVEAGDDPQAPYRVQHGMATAIERIFMAHCRADWKAYDEELKRNYPGPSHRSNEAA